jgi:hypothetical protein
MKISLAVIFPIASLLLIGSFFSCSSPSNQIQKKLTGKWVLDSELYVRGGVQKISGERRAIAFFDDGTYSYEWREFDVGNTSYGRYFILKNPNRKLYTISFIPNSSKDGFIDYMNYDIIAISNNSL